MKSTKKFTFPKPTSQSTEKAIEKLKKPDRITQMIKMTFFLSFILIGFLMSPVIAAMLGCSSIFFWTIFLSTFGITCVTVVPQWCKILSILTFTILGILLYRILKVMFKVHFRKEKLLKDLRDHKKDSEF